MGSMHRNTSPPVLSWLGWAAALKARLERSFERTSPRPPAGPSAGASLVPSGLQILVADDDRSNLEGACALLERCGASALLAVDGVQAVELAHVHDFDLILMDLQMPELDGLGATMLIRAQEKARSRPRVPVLAYTSAVPSDDLLRACGIDGVLGKPCSASALQECLGRWCGAAGGAGREARAAGR